MDSCSLPDFPGENRVLDLATGDDWLSLAQGLDVLDSPPLQRGLVAAMQGAAACRGGLSEGDGLNLFLPTFKSCSTSEFSNCGKADWPAVSITGGDCSLQCDHCKGRVLASMIPARTPETLLRVVDRLVEDGAGGMLLTGGSNHRGEVDYGPYFSTLGRIKVTHPNFHVALHTALVDREDAQRMDDSGVETAMLDLIGAQDTVSQVYHLRRSPDDFERSLEHLLATRMRVVPHIVIGLHYGKLLGEWGALAMAVRHRPHGLVLVVAMPFYAGKGRPFSVPAAPAVGRFFLDARQALPDIPLMLGCARPAGRSRVEIDTYAVMAGLDGIAHPSDGIGALASRLGRTVQVRGTCCSMGTAGTRARAAIAPPSDIRP